MNQLLGPNWLFGQVRGPFTSHSHVTEPPGSHRRNQSDEPHGLKQQCLSDSMIR